MATSSNPESTIYLITGGNRGLGRGLVAAYLSRPNNTVIATVRNTAHPTSQSLSTLPTGANSKLIVLPLSSTSPTDPATLVTTLSSTPHNIHHLDIVVANAGISTVFVPVSDPDADAFLEHMRVNVLGPIFLWQAVLPLLRKSKKVGDGKFVTVSSGAGSIEGIKDMPVPNAVYSPSKAALNWVTRKAHFEEEGLVVFPLNPGWAQTEMGNNGARAFGMDAAPGSVEDSVNGMVKVIDTSTRESHGGKFASYDGTFLEW